MKKGILCILAVFAMSIGNWSYAQFPTIGDDVLSGLTPVGGSGCSIPSRSVINGGAGLDFVTIRLGASLSSTGTVVYLPRVFRSTSCNFPTIEITLHNESDPCRGTFVSNLNLEYHTNCSNGIVYFGTVHGYTFHGTFSGANCPC